MCIRDRRLGIAQAIMEDTSLIILDEPFNGLDKHGVEEMREYFLSLKKKGKTILLTSHNTEDIEYLCDTVVEMDHGKFISVSYTHLGAAAYYSERGINVKTE